MTQEVIASIQKELIDKLMRKAIIELALRGPGYMRAIPLH